MSGVGDPAEVMNTLQRVGRALGDAETSVLETEDEPTTALGVVIVAAAVRINLLRGLSVSTRDLGVLASLPRAQVRLRIEAEDDDVPVETAKRWLGERGVEGFGPKRLRLVR
jgi:hypothetical protein